MIVDGTAAQFVERSLPDHDPIQAEMAAHAATEGFPIIGREAGAFLATVAAAREARTVFEFGSGFGYSATWFYRGMPAAGEVILTDVDSDELERADSYLRRAGLRERSHLEVGDSREIVGQYDGPFDVVLIDYLKRDYPEAFDVVAEKVAPGGVVIADNVMDGPVTHEELLEADCRDGEYESETIAGLLGYLDLVQETAGWHTSVLPVGNGLSVSVRIGE